MADIEPLSRQHDREKFDCGVQPLDDFLQRTARQHPRKYGFLPLPTNPARLFLPLQTLLQVGGG